MSPSSPTYPETPWDRLTNRLGQIAAELRDGEIDVATAVTDARFEIESTAERAGVSSQPDAESTDVQSLLMTLVHRTNRRRAEDRDMLRSFAAMLDAGRVEAVRDAIGQWADVLDRAHVAASLSLQEMGDGDIDAAAAIIRDYREDESS